MDKAKARTDLLSAGRKKLQQFRQKKDGKGESSRGKSSNKSGKSGKHESHSEEASGGSVSTTSSHVTDGNDETKADSHLLGNSLTPELSAQPVDSSSAANDGASITELSLQPLGVADRDSEVLVRNEEDSSKDVGAEMVKDLSETTILSVGSKDVTINDHMSTPVDTISVPGPVTSTGGQAIGVESWGGDEQESLIVSEDTPNTSLMNAMADQVTDVGAMQEADGLDKKQSSQSSHMEIDSQKNLSSSQVGENAQLLLGIAVDDNRIEEASFEAGQIGKAAELSSSLEDVASNRRSASSKGKEVEITIAGHVTRNLEADALPTSPLVGLRMLLPFISELSMKEAVSNSEDRGLEERPDQQYSPAQPFYGEKSHELPVGHQETNLDRPSSVLPTFDASSIDLLQLTELIRGLSEEEYSFLLKSSRTFSKADPIFSSLILSDHGISTVFERLKEELCLAVFTKDLFNLQLSEQLEQQLESDNQCYQLLNELSELRASFSEVSENNQILAEELSNCWAELHDIANKNVELRNKYASAEAEIQAQSARAHELQNCYEMSQKDALDLSKELTDCRGLISALHAENNGMNESIAMMIEEKKNLVEEKEFHLRGSQKLSTELALSTSENAKLKNQYVSAKSEIEELYARVLELQNSFETSKKDALDLSTELTGCKGLVSALQEENKEMNESIASMIEEKRRLAEENKHNLCESKKLSMELADMKISVEEIKAENISLNGELSLVTEEKNNIEAKIQHLSNEIDRLSGEMVESRDLAESLRVENSNLNGSLALSADQTTMLEEEQQAAILENQILLSQISALQEQFSSETEEQMKCKVELKEAMLQLEQVTKENFFLKSTVDEHKVNLEEISNKYSQLLSQFEELCSQAQTAGQRSEDHQIKIPKDSLPVHLEPDEKRDSMEPPPNLLENEDFYNSLGFVALKIRLDEMENIFEELENAVDQLHRSVSIDPSPGKISSAGVSNLIKAFELKSQSNELEQEGNDHNEHQVPHDPFMSSKGKIGDLRASLTKWKSDVQNAAALFKAEQDGRKSCEARYIELHDLFETLNQHCLNLEASNIELTVQYEVSSQLLVDVQGSKCHLEKLFEALNQEDILLKAKNDELCGKLGNCESKISDLFTEINDVQQNSNEMASAIGSQLENLQKEVADRAMLLEQGWNTTITEIVEATRKLDESVGEALFANSSVGSLDSLDINRRLLVSVNAATELIVDLNKKLEDAYTEHVAVCTSFKEVSTKCDDLLEKNNLAVGMLHKIYIDLGKLVLNHVEPLDERMVDIPSDVLPDPLNYANYEAIMGSLEGILMEKLELESVSKAVKSELSRREKELEELNMKCVGLDDVSKLIEDIESVLNIEDTDTRMSKQPLPHLASLVSSLVQKTSEADMQAHVAKEDYGSKMQELTELQAKIHYMDASLFERENEILILQESLRDVEEFLIASRSQLCEKARELEESEQRVSSIREKLSIAVSKGKGLVVQRDGLKHSLAETSSELERCFQELQLKDARIHEVETKLKTYAESGERAEALESELSYIRHSANALRESFLLKDSVLQRIEEILEDLDLPDQFHSLDIIEKIGWLARSAAGDTLPLNEWDQKSNAGNTLPLNDWDQKSNAGNTSPFNDLDQKSTAGGDSYSDAGVVVMDAWKDYGQLLTDDGDDPRKNFEDLKSKYYVLAEQNEMLEQSLMERNRLVQRWEELVDRIDMPAHLRSMETESRIEWLGRALVEANHHIESLQMKIEKYDSYCGLLNADLEECQRSASALQAELRAVTSEREHLSEKVEALMYECNKLSMYSEQAELENGKLRNEITRLEERLGQKGAVEEQILIIKGKISKLQVLVSDVLQGSTAENLMSSDECVDSLEVLLKMLIENYVTILSEKLVDDGQGAQKDDETLHEETNKDMISKEDPIIVNLRKDLEETLHELMQVKEVRDRNLECQISLSSEVEVLGKKTEELQELLNQEEQRSASLREKLNVAVRKGKSLVQQRDSLKQTIEEMNSEMVRLKYEISNQEKTLAEYAQKFEDLSSYPDRLNALESESLLLKNHLAETEHLLQEREYMLKMISNKLSDIKVSGNSDTSDPVKKLELVGKLCFDLQASVTSLEQESRKSKRAEGLLLAELNEVQERNDVFQEELANMAVELADIRKERDSAKAAKVEALSHLEKLSALHMEERNSYFAELSALRSSMNQLHTSFGEISELLANVLFMDLESSRKFEVSLKSCMIDNNAASVVASSVNRGCDDDLHKAINNKKRAISVDSWLDSGKVDRIDDTTIIEICHLLGHWLQDFLMDVTSLKESLNRHSSLTQVQENALSDLVLTIQKEMTSLRESCGALKNDIHKKDSELAALCGNVACLFEACTNSAIVIEHGKDELIGNKVASSDLEKNVKAASFADDGEPFSGQVQLMTEKYVKTIADRLLFAAKEFVTVKSDLVDANHKEMKAVITNLQRELQEKDVQRERICLELANQIKDAESAAKSCTQDLQASRTREGNLEKQVEKLEAERKILELKMNELQDTQLAAAELEEKIGSLIKLVSAKDQEIEALMHALDEEEMQMEQLTKKSEELENLCEQKNEEIKKLETSRGKLMKKHSITIDKFDELHHLSASLLAEVEKFQSQLQERDAEISFLRQEVTRCTNDILIASQINKRSSDEILEFLMWIDMMVSREGTRDMNPDVKRDIHVDEYKEMLHMKLTSLLSELEDIRADAESKGTQLQQERSMVHELEHKAEALEMSLREKELQLNLLEGVEATGVRASTSSTSGIVEVEPVMDKWTTASAVTSATPQVRSLRKGNNDTVAIAVDVDPGSTGTIEDEDDDKVHGFKALTTSRVIPRFTRPLSDMIDGLWVSCDRTLMRQPTLRLGIIIYWAIMHILLAFSVV